MRSVLEMFITANYIAVDETVGERRAAEYLANGVGERKKMGNTYLDYLGHTKASQDTALYKRIAAAVAKRQAELDEFAKQYVNDGKDGGQLRLPPLDQRAKKGNALRPYVMGYGLFSGDVHADPRGLEPLIVRVNGVRRLSMAAVASEMAESTLGTAYVYLVGLMTTCNERLALFDQQAADPFGQYAQVLIDNEVEPEG